MNTLTIATLLLLAGAVCGALGYLAARSSASAKQSRLRDEHARLHTALRLAEEQREQARTQCGELRSERDAVRDDLRKSEAARSEQIAKLQTATENNGQLAAEFRSVREQLQRAEADLAMLQESLETSRRQKYEVDNQLAQAHRVESELRGVLAEKEQAVNDYRTDLEKLRSAQATVEKQRAEVAAAQKQLDQLREEQSRLQIEQFEGLAAKMLALSQEKLVSSADEKLGSSTRAITEKLTELDQHLRELGTSRATGETRLGEQIKQMTEEYSRGREQTAALTEALRKPHVRGQWGEMQLKRAFELAHMREHCDFNLQVHTADDDGVQRPDAVVHLTGGRNIVIDSKVSLAAFLSACEAQDDAERDRLMTEHARQIRKHVDSLAAKEYYERVAGSPDFVLMFLPGEAILQAALEKDANLYEYALKRRIVIASPTMLVPMLRTVELSWAESNMKEHAEEVRKLGLEIYKRLGILAGHLDKLGSSLESTLKHYNSTIGSLERSVLPSARRFRELQVVREELPHLEPVSSTTRAMKAPEIVQATAEEAQTAALGVSTPRPTGA
ncbi:DNA recombination protein RmuC [Actinomadura sp. NTSP31]|uniref:DNA recombination protein RmuC n=1 Tax=Actinomadura sp. NTSP31 TaxID=1735447 RepID=UPI0035BEE34E